MKKNQNKKGFTLVELIVVIAILAVLGLLLVPQISGYIAESKRAVGEANAKSCYSQWVAKDAASKSGLTGITVEIEANCVAVRKGGAADGDITGGTWTDPSNTKYTYPTTN